MLANLFPKTKGVILTCISYLQPNTCTNKSVYSLKAFKVKERQPQNELSNA